MCDASEIVQWLALGLGKVSGKYEYWRGRSATQQMNELVGYGD